MKGKMVGRPAGEIQHNAKLNICLQPAQLKEFVEVLEAYNMANDLSITRSQLGRTILMKGVSEHKRELNL